MKGKRFNPGEFDKWKARGFFLNAIADLTPHIVDDLRENVLPVCKTADHWPESWEELNAINWPEEQNNWEKIKDSLLSWAGKNKLSYDFMLENAIYTLKYWNSNPDLRCSCNPIYKGKCLKHSLIQEPFVCGSVEFKPLNFTFKSWDILDVDTDYKKEARTAFNKALNDYIEQQKSNAIDKGFDLVTELKEPEHFKWLVYSFIQGWTSDKIACECYKSELTVRDIVKNKARLVGLAD